MKPTETRANVNALSGPGIRGLVIAALLAPMALVGDAGAGKPAYTVFMGVDLELELQKDFYRVENVTGSYFKIRINGREELISTRDGTARMRIDNALKLAGTPLEIEDLKAERAYTPDRDPNRKYQKEVGSWLGAGAAADLSTFQRNVAESNLNAMQNNPVASQAQIASAQATFDQAVQSEYNAYYSIGSDINSAAYHQQQLENELAKENYDAIEVSMHVSSPVVLDDPYVLVIARIHERDGKPGVFRNWIFAQKLDPISSKADKIYIKQGGFPIGYSLEDYQVRIYNHGREIPTNHSLKRVDLTREQAQQYLMIEHLDANKDATVPARPAFGQAPADLKERLAAGQFSEPYYVKVDAGGNAIGTYTDKDCTQEAADPYVLSFVANVLFVPALEKGKPVPGVAKLRLGALLN